MIQEPQSQARQDVEEVQENDLEKAEPMLQFEKGKMKGRMILGVQLSPDILAISIVYFVQGVLGISRLAVSFFLKDNLHLDPAEVNFPNHIQATWELSYTCHVYQALILLLCVECSYIWLLGSSMVNQASVWFYKVCGNAILRFQVVNITIFLFSVVLLVMGSPFLVTGEGLTLSFVAFLVRLRGLLWPCLWRTNIVQHLQFY